MKIYLVLKRIGMSKIKKKQKKYDLQKRQPLRLVKKDRNQNKMSRQLLKFKKCGEVLKLAKFWDIIQNIFKKKNKMMLNQTLINSLKAKYKNSLNQDISKQVPMVKCKYKITQILHYKKPLRNQHIHFIEQNRNKDNLPKKQRDLNIYLKLKHIKNIWNNIVRQKVIINNKYLRRKRD